MQAAPDSQQKEMDIEMRTHIYQFLDLEDLLCKVMVLNRAERAHVLTQQKAFEDHEDDGNQPQRCFKITIDQVVDVSHHHMMFCT